MIHDVSGAFSSSHWQTKGKLTAWRACLVCLFPLSLSLLAALLGPRPTDSLGRPQAGWLPEVACKRSTRSRKPLWEPSVSRSHRVAGRPQRPTPWSQEAAFGCLCLMYVSFVNLCKPILAIGGARCGEQNATTTEANPDCRGDGCGGHCLHLL